MEKQSIKAEGKMGDCKRSCVTGPSAETSGQPPGPRDGTQSV